MSEDSLKRQVLTEKTTAIQPISKDEFETFLRSIGGLMSGYYEDRPLIVSAGSFGVGEGWFGLLKKLIEEAIEAGWDKKLCQSKEKFAGLRFYINAAPPQVHDIISKYENLSFEICEECGELGKVRIGGWMRTLCDLHAKKIKIIKNDSQKT